MSRIAHEPPVTLAGVDLAALKRVAAIERAAAVKDVGRAITAWLQGGLKLRYSDDAVTHPAAGPVCGC